MESNKFIANFAAQFDETNTSEFSLETRFREIEEWSSLTALSIIAMIDEEYDLIINGDDVRNSSTIKDLFEIVCSKI